MGKKRKILSEAEIWDDSALIQSWDDALEEYKLYHSIRARGERVEDIIRAAEEEETDAVESNNMEEGKDRNEMEDRSLEDGEVEDLILHPPNEHPSADTREAVLDRPSDGSWPPEAGVAGATNGVPHISQASIDGSFQNEALRNLMMSWYWAGYYTGHYEGQEHAKKFLDSTTQESQKKDR